MTATFTSPEALVVSFCAGDQYYFDAAADLRRTLSEFGVDHDIRELEIPEGKDWIDICREKIRFFREMLLEHKRPIFWVDVDTKVMQRPTEILRSSADVTCFLRNFKNLVGFDPDRYTRLIAPPYLGFGYNENVLRFLDFAVEMTDASPERATDDYFLQEALFKWDGDLRFMLLRASDLTRDATSGTGYFLHGHSGNVDGFGKEATQHKAAGLTVNRQKTVLNANADALINKGDVTTALVFIKRALDLDSKDHALRVRYMDLTRRNKDWGKLKFHVEKYGDHPDLKHPIEKIQFLAALDRQRWEEADEIFETAIKSESPNVPFMKSRQTRLDYDRRAIKMGIPDEDRVQMWWMETPYPGNFGDIINPYVIEGVTGIPPQFSRKKPYLLAIGSIIKFAKPGVSVWGSGCPSQSQELSAEATYHAVRGPLTRQRLLECGGYVDEVYGDPAWFLPKIYNPSVPKTHRLGVILHSVHMDAVQNIDPDVKIIDIRRVGNDEIEAFIREMLSCEALLSTSLHGVIVAHAYGIPVRWCNATGSAVQIHGDGMKFEDYFQSVGRSAPEPLDLSAVDTITTKLAADCVDMPEHDIDLKRLAEAAPFKFSLPVG